MSDHDDPNFLYLNVDGRWPDFTLSGLDRWQDGALTLAVLPALTGPTADHLSPVGNKPDVPAGIAVGPQGMLFFSDPERHRVLMIDPCDPASTMTLLSGAESEPVQALRPRGLCIHPDRNALLVADSGHGRVQLIALDSLRLTEAWSIADDAGRSEPQSIAVDDRGFVYIADRAQQCVHRLDIYGRPSPEFWQAARTAWESDPEQDGTPQPTEVTTTIGEETTINVLDSWRRALFVFDTSGRLLQRIDLPDTAEPCGLLVTRHAIYVGDNGDSGGRLLRLDRDGHMVGEAPGYGGWVGSLAGDGTHGIWLHPGGDERPLHFDLGTRDDGRSAAAYVPRGVLAGGPFTADDVPADWHRLRASSGRLRPGARFRFFVFTSNTRALRPPPPDPTSRRLSTDRAPGREGWTPMPPDATDVLINRNAVYLWVAGVLEGDGRESPRIEQIRVDFNHETYSRYLPEIYRSEERTTLDQFLGLLESFYADVEHGIETVDRYFDVDAVPAAWLDWLAGWLGVELQEDWPEDRKRRKIAAAFAAFAWRGTPRGLREALWVDAGVDARISEPLLDASWWSLPPEPEPASGKSHGAFLGLTTRLAAAEAQGAVLGTSATLDASHLITQEEFGSPLFEEFAHQFSVLVRRSQVPDASRLGLVRAVIEREKPAHTACSVQVVDAEFRIGVQSVLGVNTCIGGGPAAPTALGEPARDGTVLSGEAAAQIGMSTRLGIKVRLSDARG